LVWWYNRIKIYKYGISNTRWDRFE
jgi:hypothetical protein